MSRIGEVVHGGPVDEADLTRVKKALLFEPPHRQKQLIRFAVLIVLSSAIATYGLLGNSVATVIGAMIIAPLMLPIMGLAFGISIGDRRAVISSILIGLAGIALSIGVGFLLTSLGTWAFDPATNGQISSRTHPGLVDLAAAIATGLAGAFATGRKDVSDTLPGVAIAISLVPPLSNVGILLALGYVDLALGSLLLFTTNYLAILLTGAMVFGIMGYPKAAMVGRSLRGRRIAIALVVVMVVVIAGPLGVQTTQIIQNNLAESLASDAAKTWIEDTDYEYVSVTVKNEVVEIVVIGEGALPPEDELHKELSGRLYGMKVRVQALPSSSFEFETG